MGIDFYETSEIADVEQLSEMNEDNEFSVIFRHEFGGI